MAEIKNETIFAVQVTNISPNANEKTVSDFFSFCGKIIKLYFDKEEGKDTNKAVVQFETESAAKTALLLTHAHIVDRPIAVEIYPPKDAPLSEPGTPVPEERIAHKDFGDTNDDERTKTSVIASLLASGYVLAQDAVTKAKEIDDEHNISLHLKVGVETLKVKAQEIDQTYRISEKATQMKQSATEKAKKIDEDYKITEKATQMKQSATEKAKKIDEDYKITEKASQAAQNFKSNAMDAATKAQENPTIKSGVDSMKSGWASVTQSVSGMYADYKDQTAKAIEEKKKEKAAQMNKQQVPVELSTNNNSNDDGDASLPPQIVPTDNK